jgi:hypothetical protein
VSRRPPLAPPLYVTRRAHGRDETVSAGRSLS